MTEPVVRVSTETFLQRDTAGDFASPTLDTVENAFNVNTSSSQAKQQVERGQIGRTQNVAGNVEETITFEMKHIVGDTDRAAFKAAYEAKTAIVVVVWEGDPETSGTLGRKHRMIVDKYDTTRAHGQPVSHTIELSEAVGSVPVNLTVS
jgi:hypothetical protein